MPAGATERGYNADARAKEREEGPVVIGGHTFHARRLTNKRLREVRRMSRLARREGERLAKETDEYREALEDAKRDGKDQKAAADEALDEAMAADSVSDHNTSALVEQLHILLVDEGMQPVPEELLRQLVEDELDQRDIQGLMNYLLGVDRQDPTPATTNGST